MPELQNFRGVHQGSFQGHHAVAGSRQGGCCPASIRGENAKKSLAWQKKKFLPPGQVLRGDAGCKHQRDVLTPTPSPTNRSSRQGQNPALSWGREKRACTGARGCKGWGHCLGYKETPALSPCPCPEHLPPLPSAWCDRWVLHPAVGKAQFVRRGEQKMSCTTMPGFSCATLIALRPLCAPGRWPGPGGLQILRLRCPGASFGVLQEKIHAFGVTPGKIHGRTAVTGSSGAGCIFLCCLGGRQQSDPEEAACGCSSLGNLDWSHTVIPVTSCKRNIKRCQTDLAKGSSALPHALQSMQKLCR